MLSVAVRGLFARFSPLELPGLDDSPVRGAASIGLPPVRLSLLKIDVSKDDFLGIPCI